MSRRIATLLILLVLAMSAVTAAYIWIQPRPIATFEAGIWPNFHVLDDETFAILGGYGDLYIVSNDKNLNKVELSQRFDHLAGLTPLFFDNSHLYGHFADSFFDIDIETGDTKETKIQESDVGSVANISLELVYGSDRASVFTWTPQDPTQWLLAPGFGTEDEEDANRITQDQDIDRFLEKVVHYAPNSNDTVRQKIRLWDVTDPSNPALTKELAVDAKTDLRQGAILLDGGGVAWTDQETLNIWDPETDNVTKTRVGANAVHQVHQLPDGTIISSGYVFYEGSNTSNRDPITKYFAPDTLEEIRSTEGLEIVKVEPWGDDKLVAMINYEDDVTDHYPIEIWHADEFVDGLGS